MLFQTWNQSLPSSRHLRSTNKAVVSSIPWMGSTTRRCLFGFAMNWRQQQTTSFYPGKRCVAGLFPSKQQSLGHVSRFGVKQPAASFSVPAVRSVMSWRIIEMNFG